MVLFGQSAGSFNTFTIATLNEAPSLISAAIMESGGGSDFASISDAQPWNELFVTTLGCRPSDVSDLCLPLRASNDLCFVRI